MKFFLGLDLGQAADYTALVIAERIAVQVLLQSGRLKIAEGLPDTKTLVRELLNFKVKIDPVTAHDSYAAWRENIHDDLVLAVAMALWLAEKVQVDVPIVAPLGVTRES